MENIPLDSLRIGYALTGSFCTVSKSLQQLRALCEVCPDVTPVMSESVYTTDTRFAKASDIVRIAQQLCGKEIIHEIRTAEPIGPKKLFDAMIILPCTGNTAAKIAAGITDTPVTMAAKAHLRNSRPLIIGIATNDALSGCAACIGKLLNTRGIYFLPMAQDDPKAKPRSVIADFDMLLPTLREALNGRQIQPIIKS